MLYSIRNLDKIQVNGGKVSVSGENGGLEVTIISSHILSVFYIYHNTIVPTEENVPYPGLLVDYNLQNSAIQWDSVIESNVEYELCYGNTLVKIDKATALLSVYQEGRLVHGGKIGHSDLVIPQYPLRVQKESTSDVTRGKFNFRLETGDAFFGLGEKTGSLNKRNRLFKLFNRDALGYDASTSDPLYKSVPFFMKINRDQKVLCGLFFPNLQVEEVNFGVESIFYYNVILRGGPYGYYIVMGHHYRDLLSGYCKLTGMPFLPPLFSFGYLTSSMGYTEPDNAQERILEFFNRIEKEDIPCEGMYFSSGYVKADNNERYTFVWNKKKFPDPGKFIRALRARGYRICCNVKPGILVTHPWYDTLASSDVFISDTEGRPVKSYYWGGMASFIDFSRKEGFNWWVKALTEYILNEGVSGVWNDNNEFEFEDEALPVQTYKKFLPVKMAQASFEALSKANPGKRPWLISRSGYTGLQRYARTWTGDNVSSYDCFRFNIVMGMNLGLSGIPIYGHDIGGFVGPTPDEELLLRWCQSALFQPRFVMHSWKSDGSITEPWLFPHRFHTIRYFIQERYRFLPYIYDLAIRASETGIPMESPVALEFPEDTTLSYESLDRMAGDAILVPGPPERGKISTEIHFPVGANWFDPMTNLLHYGGSSLKFDYPIDSLRYFFRCGTVIPTSRKKEAIGKTSMDEYEFLIIPPVNKESEVFQSIVTTHSEDDGESDFCPGSFWRWHMSFEVTSTDDMTLEVVLTHSAVTTEYRKNWRFTVPDGFVILDEDKTVLGRSADFCFTKAPKNMRLKLSGTYRINGE
jgi:alpha-glucosidase